MRAAPVGGLFADGSAARFTISPKQTHHFILRGEITFALSYLMRQRDIFDLEWLDSRPELSPGFHLYSSPLETPSAAIDTSQACWLTAAGVSKCLPPLVSSCWCCTVYLNIVRPPTDPVVLCVVWIVSSEQRLLLVFGSVPLHAVMGTNGNDLLCPFETRTVYCASVEVRLSRNRSDVRTQLSPSSEHTCCQSVR